MPKYTEPEVENCILEGLKQMPLVALEKCLEICNNRSKEILLSGALSDYNTKAY